jgi:oligoendopeptidase F
MKKHTNINRTWLFLLILIFLFLFLSAIPLKEREQIDPQYKWDLNNIYPNWEEWEKGLTRLENLMNSISEFQGKLASGPDILLKVLKLQDEIDILSYRVYRYPQLTWDLDTRNQEISAKLQQVQILFSKFATATSWIEPEMLKIPWETIKSWLDKKPEFSPYRFGIEDLYRQQAHVLDEDKEKLLSYFNQVTSIPRGVYTELSTSDINFPLISLSTGEELNITMGNYSKILATNRNQADRKLAFESHYQVFEKNKHTYASLYNGVCQKDWANAQARNYKSCLEAALEENNIPLAVYQNLINTVKENTLPLQNYIRLRKKALGLEEYFTYDGSINLVEWDKTYDYDTAKEWVLESVDPLGAVYYQKMKTALAGGWVDVYENPGKRAGAYSADVYGVHPYMLMNYNETLDNVFTLGHELGHTLHSLLSSENQPFTTHSYTIFVAEVASTFNERLLLDYLLGKSKDPKERIALLQQAIGGINGTFYFQTLLADFELQIHQLVEQGQPVTTEKLNSIMKELFQIYYGDEIVHDPLIEIVWARIPHIYRTPFYVYQYATCFASSAKIYEKVFQGSKTEREINIKRYLDLLKSGGNDYPMNQLKKAGVDLSDPSTIMAVITQFNQLVSQLELELERLN